MEHIIVYATTNDGCGKLPTKAHHDDAGWDLFASRSVVLQPHKFTDIPTDINIAMPEGWFGFITGRSSTIRVRNIRIENGIIDSGYRGEMFVGAWNLSDEPYEVGPGDRLAQLIFLPVPNVTWREANALAPSFRGIAGFGSTGG